MFAPLLLTSLPVKAAKLLTIANIMPVYVVCREHLGLAKRVTVLKEFLCLLGIIVMTLVIVPPLITFIF